MPIDKSTVVRDFTNKRSGYLPTLDGWRAIAILSVIFCHADIHTLGIFSTKWLYEYGDIGVDVFFAISGILICSRLLEEEDRRGSISLRSFYIRRAFRILPPALLYLLTVVILGIAGYLIVHKREMLAALFFYRNYTRLLGQINLSNAVFTGHFWSLSVEEHFYLILPGMLVLTKKRLRVPIMAVLICLVLINRAYQLHSRAWLNIRFHTDVRLDALLIPALIAVLVHGLQNRKKLSSVTQWWPLLLLLTVAIIPLWEGTFLKTTAIAILLPLVIMGSVLHPSNALGRVLESSVLKFIGRISYSLYLWQQLFVTAHFYGPKPLGSLERWPINIGLAFACALTSYYVVERPMMRLGHKIAPPATPGREDLSINQPQLETRT